MLRKLGLLTTVLVFVKAEPHVGAGCFSSRKRAELGWKRVGDVPFRVLNGAQSPRTIIDQFGKVRCKASKYYALECPRTDLIELWCVDAIPEDHRIADAECGGSPKQDIGNGGSNGICGGFMIKGREVHTIIEGGTEYALGGWHRAAVYSTKRSLTGGAATSTSATTVTTTTTNTRMQYLDRQLALLHNSVKAKNTSAIEQDLDALETSITLMQETLEAQSSTIKTLEANGDKLAQQVAASNKRIDALSATLNDLLSAPLRTPSEEPDKCSSGVCPPAIETSESGKGLVVSAVGGKVTVETDACPPFDLCQMRADLNSVLEKFEY